MVRIKRLRSDVEEDALVPSPKRVKTRRSSRSSRSPPSPTTRRSSGSAPISTCRHSREDTPRPSPLRSGPRTLEFEEDPVNPAPDRDPTSLAKSLRQGQSTNPDGSPSPGSTRVSEPVLAAAEAGGYLTTEELQRLESGSQESPVSFPWLRSGRKASHPVVVEAATMEVASLADFKLAPPELIERGSVERSSQSTVMEPVSPVTTGASQSSTVSEESFRAWSSQTSTVAPPWTPPSPPESSRREEASPVAPHRYRYHGPVEPWYSECFESDGYDSGALDAIGPNARLLASPIRSAGRSAAASVTSSPGFLIIGDTSLNSARDAWRPESWPSEVRFVHEQFNPRALRFNSVGVGRRSGKGCGCEARCNAASCRNAKDGRFCTDQNCAFGGVCGNALQESSSLAIARNLRTGLRGLIATAPIPAGEVIGEYFGHVQFFGPPTRVQPVNEGYRMRLHTRSSGHKYVGIDALHVGGMTRLMNHHCNPCARFHEVQTGPRLTVVAVTIRDVFPGEEVTVSYGDELWFVCRCGWWGCQHRDLQHLPDVGTPP